jgi:hypothetical protein
MGRAVKTSEVTLYPQAACLDCTFRGSGVNWLGMVRAHLSGKRDHRVTVETIRRSAYEWSER